jgi:hypothetical protein
MLGRTNDQATRERPAFTCRGKQVVELGAGYGLAGLAVAACTGASGVVLMNGNPQVLDSESPASDLKTGARVLVFWSSFSCALGSLCSLPRGRINPLGIMLLIVCFKLLFVSELSTVVHQRRASSSLTFFEFLQMDLYERSPKKL